MAWRLVLEQAHDPFARQGHLVAAVDVPGRWARPDVAAATTPSDFVESVGQVLRASPAPVVLVGHSLGGATISLAAEAYPDRVARPVYVSAFLVPSGQTVGAIAMSDKGALIPTSVRRDAATRTSTVIHEKAKELFYADCSDDDVDAALRLLCAEPATMTAARMSLSSDRSGRVHRTYVECLQDRAISIETQRSMAVLLQMWGCRCPATAATSKCFAIRLMLATALSHEVFCDRRSIQKKVVPDLSDR